MTEKLIKLFDLWPTALIGFGLVLTLVWMILLIWFPLHLFQVL
jgi:hypothetical protein